MLHSRVWPRTRRLLRTFQVGAAELLFDHTCRVCKEEQVPSDEEIAVCDACRSAIQSPVESLCQRCGIPVGPHLPTDDCVACRSDRFAFTGAVSCGKYEGPLKSLILESKAPYGATTAVLLGRLLAGQVEAAFPELPFDLVVPVPVHWRTRVRHSYHAADPIAETIACQFGLPFEPRILRKTRVTPKQSTLSGTVRRRNLRNAFGCHRSLKGLRCLLVDDVMTSGATATECAKAMLTQGAQQVALAVGGRATGIR